MASVSTTSKSVLNAPSAARAAVAARPAAAPPPGLVHIPPPKKPDGRLRLDARALKVTMVVDPEALAGFEVPAGSSPVEFMITIEGRKVTGRFNAKSLRKAAVAVTEHGAEQVAVVVQGRLADNNVLEEAGLSVNVKAPKPAAAP